MIDICEMGVVSSLAGGGTGRRALRGARAVVASLAALLPILLLSAPASAQRPVRPSLVDSFRLGTGGDTLCQVQRVGVDPRAPGLFDRAYSIVCRDAAAPIGRLYAVRTDGGRAEARIAAGRADVGQCAPADAVTLTDVGTVVTQRCLAMNTLPFDVLSVSRGNTLFVAEGLAGYRSALELGLRTLVADRLVPGSISIALTGAGDARSFARAQAGSLDPALALAEGYRRNNAGNYAEASEFFDTLLQRSAAGQPATTDARDEYLINRALQLSDLGNYDQADALFAAAVERPDDPVSVRQHRNYRAIDLINRGEDDKALALLDRPIVMARAPVASNTIDPATARALNEAAPLATRLGIGRGELTPAERVVVLDAQTATLRGGILRAHGRKAEAAAALTAAATALEQLREGRVASVARLQAQVYTEQAALAESGGDQAEAERLLRLARAKIAGEYPASIALDAADARLAAYFARRGRTSEALDLFRSVTRSIGARGGASGIADLLQPYIALLVATLPSRPALADDLFVATQALLRPGVADTQATLARELSGGSGEAARLFRESLNQARQINIARVELERLTALPQPTAEDRAGIAADRARIAEIEAEQSVTQARLTAFPAYRAITTQALDLAGLRAVLRPGETYWKLTVVGDKVFALLVTQASARAWALPFGPVELAARVDALRAGIVRVEAGRTVTPPFDPAAARALFVALAGPAANELRASRHLVFEPDGAMLRLPVGLLIVDGAGVDRWRTRQTKAGADPFDLTGIDWLGARADVSVALSARAFRDVRVSAPSRAAGAYLGFGQNAPVSQFLQLTSYTPPAGAIDCAWPLSSWSNPISAAELVAAREIAGAARSLVVTGERFTDTDITSRRDLAAYRILHFATHGLVVAPRPQCPAIPALMTSFGAGGSDGLLTFGEVYDLRLDADLVILSACDTAGSADVAVTRAAGIETGGGNALDGLVRAFIGAGSRSVLASHWPVPDDYGATAALIGGLFTAPPGTAAAEALRLSQLRLQSRAETSHPYYWAGFALIGDGAQPVLRTASVPR